MVVVLTLLRFPIFKSFKISQVVFASLQNFGFDVFSKPTSVIAILQSYTTDI